jgi:hypothetical protein
LNGTVVFFQDHPDKLVALVIGVGPLILFFGWLFFYAWLARPADMMTHSFVRFPWVAGLAAGVTAAYRGDSSVVWALTVPRLPRGTASAIAVGTALNQNRNETLRRNQAHELEMIPFDSKGKASGGLTGAKDRCFKPESGYVGPEN